MDRDYPMRYGKALDEFERLRDQVEYWRARDLEGEKIEAELRAEIERLEAALHKIEDGRGGNPRQIAKDALMHDALRAHGSR